MKNILWLTTILASLALLLSLQTKADTLSLQISQTNDSFVAENPISPAFEFNPNSNYQLPEWVEIESEKVKEQKEQNSQSISPKSKLKAAIFYKNYLPDNLNPLNGNQCQAFVASGLYLLFHSLVLYE
jgi:hypothetical protein